ncbi:MAG: insulinase family protein [Planctomycetes bacterium]|nr:insulinase family protein [Planctomycetota bacterium]MBL6909708.1 insulinase family protein [Pirellulales bacterium]
MNHQALKNIICVRPLAGVIAVILLCFSQVFAIPPRPEAIEFQPLEYTPPRAADFRRMLSDGTIVYVAESHEFPLVNVSITFKGGGSLDPAATPGLASVMARMVREGGAGDMSPAMFDETLDFLATEMSVSAGNTFTTARMNSLSGNLDESLQLFVTMLRKPAFEKQRLEVVKARLLESLKQRNDNASSILAREWKAMLYGRNHFEASQPTASSVEAISREQLEAIHRQIIHPGNMIVAVSGDFAVEEMLEKLTEAFQGWERGAVAPDPKMPEAVLVPGLYHVQKEIPQGKVVLGKRGIVRDDPDAIPLLLLNEILGAGGFTSRLMQKVRSNEGLAYSVRSILSQRINYPGAFQATFESKNPTVALATKIVLGEIALIRQQPVTDEEIEVAKQGLIETFPRQFESKPTTLQVFVNDEWTNRPKDYWQTFREKVRSVTKDDLLRVAKKHLDPSQMAILVVGDWEAIASGDLEGRATMKEFFGGEVKHLPLRDPLTLEPLPLD